MCKYRTPCSNNQYIHLRATSFLHAPLVEGRDKVLGLDFLVHMLKTRDIRFHAVALVPALEAPMYGKVRADGIDR